ncbi:hypothetical protein HCH_00369 [Hahella chejuensis KCTC 2396]|uniref:Uncharacterized protein n=1 Tax=Hahella chejuensis (strain KCTC 2396) TaxID=349521 RepID=Q2SPZ4_HAHCH|nr:hypothetical protein HCH_00369 [Hahella chejuensis KCTC 2396]
MGTTTAIHTHDESGIPSSHDNQQTHVDYAASLAEQIAQIML